MKLPHVEMPEVFKKTKLLKGNNFITALCTPGAFDHLDKCKDCGKENCICDSERENWEEREATKPY
jgi:hypothetical protein